MPQGTPSVGGVAHLAGHDEPVGLVEQAAGRCAHHEGGHQVLEHGPGPRDQGRAATDGRQRAAEPEPVVRGDIALGDRQEAGQAGLGGEEVVVARIQRAVADPKPDREELAGRVEQEAEVRLPEELLGLGRRSPGVVATSDAAAGGPPPAVGVRCDRPARRVVGKAVPPAEEVATARGPARGCSRPAESPRPRSRARPAASSPRSAVKAAATSDKRQGLHRELAQTRPPRPRASPGHDDASPGGQLQGVVEVPSGERLASVARRRSRRQRRGSSARASPIPATAAATGSGWSIIWRQALDSASR